MLYLTNNSVCFVPTDDWQPSSVVDVCNSIFDNNNNNTDIALIICNLETTSHSLVYPLEANHPVYGTGIHRLTDEELAVQHTWEVVGKKWMRWIEEEQFTTYLLLSHGSYDKRVMERDFKRAKLNIPQNWIFCNAQNLICRLLNVREWSVRRMNQCGDIVFCKVKNLNTSLSKIEKK